MSYLLSFVTVYRFKKVLHFKTNTRNSWKMLGDGQMNIIWKCCVVEHAIRVLNKHLILLVPHLSNFCDPKLYMSLNNILWYTSEYCKQKTKAVEAVK